MKVAVVTPTIGSPVLKDCLQSVQKQTYKNLTHYVFVDGEQYFGNSYLTINENCSEKEIKTISLQENVGKGWYGHRVYSACSFLVNADIICYLDEDNWFEPNHVEKLVETMQSQNYDWVYSLRKIHDKDGSFICNDNCESLGKWPVYVNDQVYHIDTSCFAVKTEVATKIGHAWYGQWGADRQFFYALRQYFPHFTCSANYSLCYRLDGNPNSVNREFFEIGNQKNYEKYSGVYPWLNQYVQIGPGIILRE